MQRIRLSVALVLPIWLLARPAAGAEPRKRTEWALSFTSLGPLRIGMTVPEAEKALKMKLHEDEAEEPDGCHYASNAHELPGVGLMLEGRRVVRIDVFSGAYRTKSGVHIGMTEEDVRARHPSITSEEHHYDPSGHYLSFSSDDRRYRILFETDGRVVTRFRSGERRAVAHVEGCQ